MGSTQIDNDNGYSNPSESDEQKARDEQRNEQLNLIASFIVTINAFFKGIEDSYRKCQYLSKKGITCDGPEMALDKPVNPETVNFTMTGGNDPALGQAAAAANPPYPQKQKSLMDIGLNLSKNGAQAAASYLSNKDNRNAVADMGKKMAGQAVDVATGIAQDPEKRQQFFDLGTATAKRALDFASDKRVQNTFGKMANSAMGLTNKILQESQTQSTGDAGAVTVTPDGLIGVDDNDPLPIGSALVSMAFNVISAGLAAAMTRFLQEITGTGEDGKVIEIEQLNNLLSKYAERLKEIANNPKLLKQIQDVARLKAGTSVVQTKVTLDAAEGIMAALLNFFANFLDTAANTGIQLLEDLVEEEIEFVPGANVLVALFSAMQSAGNLVAETIGSGTTSALNIAEEMTEATEAIGAQRKRTREEMRKIQSAGSYKKKKFIHELNLKDDIYSKILILESQDMTMENIINLKKMLKLYNSDFIQSEKCNKDYLFGILYGNRLAEPIINFYKYKLNQYKPKKKK